MFADNLAKFYGISIDALIHHNNAVGKTKIAPAPIGKHLWGMVTIGSKRMNGGNMYEVS